MAINTFFKLLDSATPNLSLQSNQEHFLLWGTAGTLNGLAITSVVNSGGSTVIDLTPGAFVHQGIVVQYPEGAQITLTTPGAFSLSDPLYLIAQSNGPDEGNLPNWSFMAESTYRAQPDYRNFAAVIGIYRLQILPNSIVQQIGFDADSTVAWAKNPLTSTLSHFQILNGTNAEPNTYLDGIAGNVDVIGIQNLGGNAQSVTQCILTAKVKVDNVAITTTRSASQVTVGGAATAGAGERFSVYFDGVEAFYKSLAGGESNITVANGLRTAITASGIATVDAPGSAVINITSVQFGDAGNYDMQVTETSPTTTLTITIVPAGGAQGSILVEFPTEDGSTTGAEPVTIYPPVPLAVGPGTFSIISLPVIMINITAETFNNMKFRITAQAPGTEIVSIAQTFITLNISELNLAIDPAPPTELAHWISGPNVSVGGGQGTSLQAHRTLIPIDHPDRSIPRLKLMTRAVGSLEIDQFVVGGGFAGAFHTPAQLALPWLISSDLNLEECSDLIKQISLQLNNGLSGLAALFAQDHSINFGHHKSATYTDLTTALAVPPSPGMRIETLPTGDAFTDLLATGWNTSPAMGVVTTEAQFGLLSDNLNKTGMLSTRTATLVPIPSGTATVRDLVISSPEQAAAGKIGLAIGMDEGSVPGDAKPHITAAYKLSDIKPLSGLDAINGVNARGFQSNVMSLFSGSVCFFRTDRSYPAVGDPWRARTTDVNFLPHADMLAQVSTSVDGGATSYVPKPGGAAFYFNASRGGLGVDFETFAANLTTASHSSLVGHFPCARGPDVVPTTVDLYSTASSIFFGTQWLYLPFPFRNSMRKVRIKVTLNGAMWHLQSGGSFVDALSGIIAAPAYDAKLVSATQSTPIPTGFTPGTVVPTRSSGIIRRHPWVLTPDGYRRPNATLAVVPGSVNDGIYYKSGAGQTFLVPLGETPAWEKRLTTLTTPTGVIPSNSILSQAPLPYYDKDGSGGVGAAGIYIDGSQMISVQSDNPVPLGTSSGFNLNEFSSSVEVTLDLKTPGGNFIVPSGSAASETPTGIAISTNRFDWGFHALVGGTLSNTNLNTNFNNIHSPTDIESIVQDLVYVMSIEVDGIADGNFQLVPSKY